MRRPLRDRLRSSKPIERRVAARYPAEENRAQLGWWDGDTFQEAFARVGDINQGGARVVVAAEPPAQAPVWLRLETPAPTDWCPAAVVRTRDAAGGSRELGLGFLEPCPYDMFKALRGLHVQGQAI